MNFGAPDVRQVGYFTKNLANLDVKSCLENGYLKIILPRYLYHSRCGDALPLAIQLQCKIRDLYAFWKWKCGDDPL